MLAINCPTKVGTLNSCFLHSCGKSNMMMCRAGAQFSVLGGKRFMSAKGNLVLDFLNVSGKRPDDRVDIFLKHRIPSNSLVIRYHSSLKRLKIEDLDSTQGGVYTVKALPMRHQS